MRHDAVMFLAGLPRALQWRQVRCPSLRGAQRRSRHAAASANFPITSGATSLDFTQDHAAHSMENTAENFFKF
jgi:hypothetical protein